MDCVFDTQEVVGMIFGIAQQLLPVGCGVI